MLTGAGRTIAFVENLLVATLQPSANGDYELLVVEASVRAKTKHPYFAPVLELLDQQCHEPLDRTVHDDPQWHGRQCCISHYAMFPICPHNQIPHQCAIRQPVFGVLAA